MHGGGESVSLVPLRVKAGQSVHVGTRGLELGWIDMEQETACVSMTQGKEQDDGANCDDEWTTP